MSEDWERLGLYVRHRRVELGMKTQGGLADASTLNRRTINQLEGGKPVSKTSLALVDQALDWKPGGCAAVLHGGAPTPRDADRVQPTFLDPQEQEIWNLPALDEGERWELINKLREIRGRHHRTG